MTGAKDAKMQKDPIVSPQASQTPSAKTWLKGKSLERQPKIRRQECSEAQEKCSTKRVDQSISARTGLSRGVPADHEAQSQVKQKTAAKSEGIRRSRYKKDGTYRKIQDRGSGRPRA